MSIFSKTCEYAMRAIFFIAKQSKEGKKAGIKEIAENIGSPEPFLAKILQNLRREGLVESTKGPNGGFYLDEKGLARPLADVVATIEGDSIFTGCGIGLSYCSEENPCPLHNEFKKVRNQIVEMLNKITIGQFNDQLVESPMEGQLPIMGKVLKR